MFEWLFPNWSHPLTVATVVIGRTLFNVLLTTIVAKSVGLKASLTAVAAAATLLSTALMVVLLRPSTLGVRVSYAEIAIQVALFFVAGYAVYSNPSATRLIVVVVVFLGAIGLLPVMVLLYGEAFVAP